MNSELFKMIGIDHIDIAYLFIGVFAFSIILLILLIVQMVMFRKLRNKYNKFMEGKEVKSLEKEIIDLYEDNQFLKTESDKNRKDIRSLYKKVESSYQKCGIVKYDAFKQMGGKLSFSLALLNENNCGFIINSVHSSDGCYSYTKEIVNGESAISLGEEEKEALDKAMGL